MKARDARCPFCAAPQRESAAPSLAMVLGIAAGVSACADRSVADDGNGSAGATSTGGETSTSDDPPTTSNTSATVSSAGPTSAEVSTSLDTGDVTTDSSSGVGFIYGSASTNGLPIECSTYDQDCPIGEKCMPWANDGGDEWNSTKCVPVAPEAIAEGERCHVDTTQLSGLDDCDVGLICWFADDALEGFCIPLCSGGAAQSCEDAGQVCVEPNEFAGLCLFTCDPKAPVCPGGLECVPDGVCS